MTNDVVSLSLPSSSHSSIFTIDTSLFTTDLRYNLRNLGSTYDSLDQLESTLKFFSEWSKNVPQLNVYRRFIELRHRHLCQQIHYLENDYPKIKKCIQDYAKREKAKSQEKAERLSQKLRTEIDAQTTEATGATSHSTITTQRDSTSQFGHASAEEFGDISQPTWTRRWSAWIEPRWKQEPPMHMDEEHGDGTMQGQHFGAIEGLYASPDLEVFSSVKSLPARHHRTSRAIGIDPNSTESRPSFVKVRKHRHGRAATPVDVRCSHIEDSSSKRKGFVKHKEEDEASRRKAEADRNMFRDAILSEVETDLEIISDQGIDTETDEEGRSATRCLIFDPLDGLPHPFWGVEVEQSSWVSIPNPAKLDPECKILHMFRLLKPEAYPRYNSTLLVRHYKPFLKYGMFPDTLFELWGRGTKNNEFLQDEIDERKELQEIENYITPYESSVPPKGVLNHECSNPGCSNPGCSSNQFSYYRPLHKENSSSVKPTKSEIDLEWMRSEVQRFQENLFHNRASSRRIPESQADIDELQIPCPIDPTWRNVYSSRVRILKRSPKRTAIEVLALVLSEYEKSPDRTSLPATKVSLMRGSKSFQQIYKVSWMKRLGTTSCDDRSLEETPMTSLYDEEYSKSENNDKRFRSSSSVISLMSTAQTKFQYHKAEPTLSLKRITSTPDQSELRDIIAGRKEQRDQQNSTTKRFPNESSGSLSQEPDEFEWIHGISGITCPVLPLDDVTLRQSISFENQLSMHSSQLDELTPLPLQKTDSELQRLQLLALKKRVENRPKLRARKGKRLLSHHEGVLSEGLAWLKFHQIRDIRTREDWPPIPPSPVPAPSSTCLPIPGRRSSSSRTSLSWPTFVPTIFRGPAQYDDLQEAFLHILWSTRKSKRRLPTPKKTNLKVWISGYMIPHDDKRFRYGDDSWFGSEPLMAFGVCDGVGEMSDTQWRVAGFDCRGFGEDILREAKARFQTIRTSSHPIQCTRPRMELKPGFSRSDKKWRNIEFEVSCTTNPPSLLSLEALVAGFYGKTTTWGAATCLVGCLNECGNRVGFANIGDSKAMVLRRGQFSTGPLDIVGATIPEQHGWNLPVQLARLPDRSRVRTMRDDPRLSNLVKTLDSCRATGQDINDPVETATLFDFDVQEGDLIVVGTDGLWDNLFDEEIETLCGIALSPLESEWVTGSVFMSTSPRDVAKGLSLAAYWKSIQISCETPFSHSVRDSGGVSYGGKPDDITVMAAWVVSAKDENTPTLLERCQLERKLMQR